MEMSLTDFVTHVIMSDHIISAVSTVINEEFYQTLPGDLQKVLVDGSRVASDMVNIRRPEIEEESVNAMREMGIEIVYPTAEEMAQWRSIAEPVGRRILGEKVNPRYFDMLTMAVDEVVDSR